MKHVIFCGIILPVLFLLTTAALPCILFAETLNTYADQELGFSFQYPGTWSTSGSSTANVRIKVAAPANAPTAECAVVVKHFPKAVSAKQSDIDQIFNVPPTVSEIEDILKRDDNALKVLKAGTGTLHPHPAHTARVQYQTSANAFASGSVIMTATPGLTWTLSCSGLGDTPAKAQKNYQYWERKLNDLIASFRFK